jgi:hypothetical protein
MVSKVVRKLRVCAKFGYITLVEQTPQTIQAEAATVTEFQEAHTTTMVSSLLDLMYCTVTRRLSRHRDCTMIKTVNLVTPFNHLNTLSRPSTTP